LIRDTNKIKEEMLKKSEKKINQFIDELQEISQGKEFTIDNIELLMTKYNKESKQDLIESIDNIISNFDESKIIEEKKD